ncbi:CPBP family intramembrane glutamic endopeptidase [Mycobacteroides abscessus]|uniref:CPBP family intramembrane glutamic endopeptidase n=1 Tax=Mycobacteroides abscessus TaxID=36809 RepID=UPI000929314E|nr:CPBP family intramembrane glutamic endopeptidase [Mycobacteroides abscessus]SHQ48619.1 Uncharacterised protein [Mycobacteroides abscessus subsp. abscessus]SKQ85278.1 Uncharacterised protein [Mycobacteroides abscessus subsp. massiliense]SLC49140.1 Uncharacterised protein [Mycobacteroides abscessus subsp. massiliense]
MKGVAFFCISCFALAAYIAAGLPETDVACATAATVAITATAFFILVTYHDPDNATARILVYASGVGMTQGVPITVAFWVLSQHGAIQESRLEPEDLLLKLAQAALSVAVFYIVKAWTKKRVRQPYWPDTSPQKAPWATAAALGTAIVLSFAMEYPAISARSIATSAGNTDFSSPHADTGGTAQWWLEIGSSALAGVHEEPVYVGLALLLWPYRGSLTALIPVAVATSFARSLIHVYYAAGQPHPAAALLAVFVWCAVWSTANLAITYRTKTLVPVIIAHGLFDIHVTNLGTWDIQGPLATLTHSVFTNITNSVIPLWVLVLVGLAAWRWFKVQIDRSNQLQKNDATLCAFRQIRKDLGISHSQMLKAAGLSGREFRSWVSKPLYLRPWDHPPQQFLALQATVDQLRSELGPKIGDWLKSDPTRLSALLAGQFDTLQSMASSRSKSATAPRSEIGPVRAAG